MRSNNNVAASAAPGQGAHLTSLREAVVKAGAPWTLVFFGLMLIVCGCSL
jgi:hypothetical protein